MAKSNSSGFKKDTTPSPKMNVAPKGGDFGPRGTGTEPTHPAMNKVKVSCGSSKKKGM